MRARSALVSLAVLGAGALLGMTFFGDRAETGDRRTPAGEGASSTSNTDESVPSVPTHPEENTREEAAASQDRSEAGAQLAAVRFLELTENVVALSPEEAADLQRSISTADAADELARGVADSLVSLRAEVPEGVTAHVAPIAVGSVERWDGWNVAVWYVEVLAYGDQVAIEQWRTATYLVEWEGGEWRMSGLDSVDGPTPVRPAAMTASSTAELLAAVGSMSDQVLEP